MPARKSGLTPETTKTRIVHYAIIQTPQLFLELIQSALQASNWFKNQFLSFIYFASQNCLKFYHF